MTKGGRQLDRSVQGRDAAEDLPPELLACLTGIVPGRDPRETYRFMREALDEVRRGQARVLH